MLACSVEIFCCCGGGGGGGAVGGAFMTGFWRCECGEWWGRFDLVAFVFSIVLLFFQKKITEIIEYFVINEGI
jgi:hypothetical protein